MKNKLNHACLGLPGCNHPIEEDCKCSCHLSKKMDTEGLAKLIKDNPEAFKEECCEKCQGEYTPRYGKKARRCLSGVCLCHQKESEKDYQPHRRGSHSDDFEDTEPCYCDKPLSLHKVAAPPVVSKVEPAEWIKRFDKEFPYHWISWEKTDILGKITEKNVNQIEKIKSFIQNLLSEERAKANKDGWNECWSKVEKTVQRDLAQARSAFADELIKAVKGMEDKPCKPDCVECEVIRSERDEAFSKVIQIINEIKER